MKTRIGIMISMLGVSVIANAAMIEAQQAPEAQERAAQTRTPLPSTPSTPSTPSIASTVSTPSATTAPTAPRAPTAPTATTAPTAPSAPNMDPFGDVLFPPDLIMRHARELGITSEQKAFMRSEIQRTTTRFNELQWQLQDAIEALSESMKSNSVNEQQALAYLDKVLDAERAIKHLQIGMCIRIKNQLTTEQQQKLHALRLTPRPGQPG